MIVLLTAHGLYDRPAVIVCLALVPFFLEMGVFSGMAALWVSVGQAHKKRISIATRFSLVVFLSSFCISHPCVWFR